MLGKRWKRLMDIDPQPFNIGFAIIRWLLVVGVFTGVGLLVGFVLCLLTLGSKGPSFFGKQIARLFGELANLSPARVGAITGLAVKESLRRKALWIFAVFALLFMFAGWFLGSSEYESAKPYVAFVLTTVKYLSLPLAVLLACWGLPADIKARSLHTVVTKPVRRTEVVLGRMLGYSAVTAAVIVVMGAIGAIWIVRQVPARAQDQLISRVPVYASGMKFLDRFGKEGPPINVGDVWTFRGYVEGATKARVIYEFKDLDLASYLDAETPIRLEYNFEIFRSYKGDVGEKVAKGLADRAIGVQAQLAFVNPKDPENESDDVLVRYPRLPFEVVEFSEGANESILEVPLTISGESAGGETVEYNLIEDLAYDSNGDGTNDALKIEVRCIDGQQYLGAARTDMFIRLPDKPFMSGYTKAVGGVLLTAVLVIIIGTTASTFVKGPVATLLTIGVIVLGLGASRNFADEYLGQFVVEGQVSGGGPFESLYRLVTQKPLAVPLDDSGFAWFVQKLDYSLLFALTLAFDAVPDLRPFDMTDYVANGFDVPFNTAFLPSLCTVLGFLVPCVIVGYFSLQLRELESK